MILGDLQSWDLESGEACVSEEAWQTALALCSRIPCDNDVPLLTMKLQAFQAGKNQQVNATSRPEHAESHQF